jgi:hypothetical protein
MKNKKQIWSDKLYLIFLKRNAVKNIFENEDASLLPK